MNPPPELLRAWRRDPLKFCADVGFKPREWQPDALRDIADYERNAESACRKAGKTRLAAYATWWNFITTPRSSAVLVAPVLSQLQRLWDELSTTWGESRLPSLFPAWEVFKFEVRSERPNSRIVGLSAETGEHVEGVHGETGIFVVLDECKGLNEATYRSLTPMLADGDCGILAISTPAGSDNLFSRLLLDPEWKVRHVSAMDLDRLRPWGEEMVRKYGQDHPFVVRQVLARPCDADEGESVLRVSAVYAAAEREPFKPEPWEAWPGVLGVDVGGRGKDFTAACYRKGPNFLRIHTLGQFQDEMQTCGRIVRLAEELRVQRIVIDAIGIGGAMASRLEEIYQDPTRRRVEILRFIAGSRARDTENFVNLKSELIFQLRRRLLDGNISLPSNDPRLIAELIAFGSVTTSRGAVRTTDPASSPDRADALLMALYGGEDAVDSGYRSVATARPAFLGY